MLRVNFLGSVWFTRALLPAMVERGSGAVVFVASVAGKIASPDESVYAASKFAVVGLASALAAEVEDAGVHVMTVCPGVIDTPFFDAEMLERMPPAARRSMVAVDGLVDAVIAGLRRGRAEVTHPPAIAAGAAVAGVLQALAPGFMRRQVKRSTIDAVARRRRSQPA
jgi:short-subunit dehydrogenase